MVRVVKPPKHYRMQPVAVNQTKCYKCGAETLIGVLLRMKMFSK